MYRSTLSELEAWKNRRGRMPLLVVGARQVGKTWLLKHFGDKSYKNLAYLSFDSSPALAQTLDNTVRPKEILPVLSAETGVAIHSESTLIVFDEIQDCPRALLALKYFQEEAPQYHIIAAGSTLGVMLHQSSSFPVGKVDFLDLYPLSFDEFLRAIHEQELADFAHTQSFEHIKPFHDKLLRILREYLYVGGMPAVVDAYANARGDYGLARAIQENILRTYDRDFSKYTKPLFASKLRAVWQSLPAQLAKENRRFTYAQIKTSARGRDYAAAIQWLKDSSMATPVYSVKEPRHPLKAYENDEVFKLFIHDVGLMSAMADVNPGILAGGKNIFLEFKGSLAEQFVFQELMCNGIKQLFYWSNESSTASIDFLLQNREGLPIPLEVKSGINLRAKSLMVYRSRYAPAFSLRTSLADYKHDCSNKIFDLPIYAVSRIGELL